jgi:hypothetical protein
VDVRQKLNLSGTGTIYDQDYDIDGVDFDIEWGEGFLMNIQGTGAKQGAMSGHYHARGAASRSTRTARRPRPSLSRRQRPAGTAAPAAPTFRTDVMHDLITSTAARRSTRPAARQYKGTLVVTATIRRPMP